MDDRIDHAAEARKWLEYSADLNPEVDWPRISHASVLAASHAALAAVDQQRIANRIALAAAIRKDLVLGGNATDLSEWLHEGNGVVGYFSAAEQEELGVA